MRTIGGCLCFFIMISFGAISAAHAATVINTPTCSSSDVQAAINSAAEGDTVSVHSGNCTWSGTAVVKLLNKGLKLQGAGIDSTNIILNNDYAFRISSTLGAAHNYEVSGFTFINNNTGWNATIGIANITAGYARIHHNKFTQTPTAANGYDFDLNTSHVLVDNNTFEAGKITQHFFIQNNTIRLDELKKPIAWGQNFSDNNVDWVYIEQNTFHQPCGTSGDTNGALEDVQDSGKVVIRYNTIYNGYFLNHAACWSYSGITGGMAMDVYGNKFIEEDGCYVKSVGDLMGGTLLFHDNVIYFYGTGNLNFGKYNQTADTYYPFQWQDSRTLDTSAGCRNTLWQYCDGARNMWCSGSTGQNWYTCNAANPGCTDTSGTNRGTCSLKHCSNSWTLCSSDSQCSGGTCSKYLDDQSADPANTTGYRCFNGTGSGRLNPDGTIDLDPVYIWNNHIETCNADGSGCAYYKKVGAVPGNANISKNSTFGRDIIDNGTTPKPGYTSYKYPHPLTDSSVPRLYSK